MNLEADVRELQALEAIRRLKYEQYCRTVDLAVGTRNAKAMQPLLDRFVEDIDVQFTGFPAMSGKTAAAAFFTEGVMSMLSWCQHRVGNPIIDVDGNKAAGEWTIFCPGVGTASAPTGAGPLIIIGRYAERYQLYDGLWMWSQIHARFDVLAASGAGWDNARWPG